jgi:hypothetical protein
MEEKGGPTSQNPGSYEQKDAQAAGSRLRHQDAAELDGPQGFGIDNGLFESSSKQRCNRARKFKRTCRYGQLRARAARGASHPNGPQKEPGVI